MAQDFYNQQKKEDGQGQRSLFGGASSGQQGLFGMQQQGAGGLGSGASQPLFGGAGLFGSQQGGSTTPQFGGPGGLQQQGNVSGTSMFGNQSGIQTEGNIGNQSSQFGNMFGGGNIGQQGIQTSQVQPQFGMQTSQTQQQPGGMIFGGQQQTSTSTSSTAPFGSGFGQGLQQANISSQSQQNAFGGIQPQMGTPGFQTQNIAQPTLQGGSLFGGTTMDATPRMQIPQTTTEANGQTRIQQSGIDGGEGERSRASVSVFGQSSGEKGIGFLQMTLNEIIQQQTRKLEENVKMFKERAREVFEQDERIIAALNNYRVIRSKIDEEERVIGETEESVEFFEKWLGEFAREVPEGEGDRLVECITELERVSDRFNRTIEALKDDEDEVLCLVNENYGLISIIEERLYLLEKYQ